jgi:leucyl-tRNA synthetase
MENGILSEPSEFAGRRASEVKAEIIKYAQKKGFAKPVTKYHLRDWLVSRQRYWGAPIPMVYCAKCDWNPVPDTELPVILPHIKNFKPLGTGKSPLATEESFVKTKCPNCKGDARRETDVFDTFMDSSWYFLRYPSAHDEKRAMTPELTKKWLPVNIYIGGAEHSVLHLLYARFITKALYNLKFLDFDEPFTKFRAHGLLVKEGGKMSKSKGNIINPDVYLQKFGADVLRLYLMFLGPYTQGGDFRDSGIEGMQRFLKRVNSFVQKQLDGSSARNLEDPALDKILNKTVKKVTEDLTSLSYNTAIAKIMEYLNALNDFGRENKLSKKYSITLVQLLAPFAPFLAEELYHRLEPKAESVHISAWPSVDESISSESEGVVAVQINGKLADTFISSLISSQDQVQSEALKREKVKNKLSGKNIKKVIFVPGKVINFVV